MGRPWEQLKRFYWYRDFCFITSCDDDLRFCCKMMAKSLRAIKPRGRDRGRNEAYKAQCAKSENESGLMKLSLSVSLFVYLPVHFFASIYIFTRGIPLPIRACFVASVSHSYIPFPPYPLAYPLFLSPSSSHVSCSKIQA